MKKRIVPVIAISLVFVFSGCFAQIDSFVFLTPVDDETLKVDLNFIFWFWGEGKKKTEQKDMKKDFEEFKENLSGHGAKVTDFKFFDHSYGNDRVSRTQVKMQFEVSSKKEIPIQLLVAPNEEKEKKNFFGLPSLKYDSDKIVFKFPEAEKQPEPDKDNPQAKQQMQMKQMATNVVSSLFSLTLAFPETVQPERVSLVIKGEPGEKREDLPVIQMDDIQVVKIPSMALINVLKDGYRIEVKLKQPEKTAEKK